MLCPVCGNEFVSSSSGRPRIYCSSTCRDYCKYKNALENILLHFKADSKHISLVRGDMFRLANILSNGTKKV